MKLNGFVGTGSGKLGSSVFSTVAGQQVVRQYQPTVSNPSTVAQMEQRSKLKLASQMAAALSPVIAIPRKGLQSSRNLFVKKNWDSFDSNGGIAQVTYENLQLTDGNAGLPAIRVARDETAGTITAQLAVSADGAVSRVVYIMYVKNEEKQLQYVNSYITEEAGENGTFPCTFDNMDGELVFYAYGMRDLNSAATGKYGNYSVANASDLARLILTRNINTSDYQLTRTRGTTLGSNASETTEVPDGSARVYVTASGNGTVSGGGIYEIGQNCTVTATPSTNNVFKGWKRNGETTYLSTNASYTFQVSGMTDLVAVFEIENGSLPGGGDVLPGGN